MFNKTFRIIIIHILILLSMITLTLAQEQTKESLTYENVAMGVKIAGPKGWNMIPDEKRTYVRFTQYTSIRGTSIEWNPTISLGADKLKPEDKNKTPLDVAKINIPIMKMMLNNFEIIKEPTTVMQNGLGGVNFVFEDNYVRQDNRKTRIRESCYIFIKNNILYTLIFNDEKDNFDNNAKSFEYSLNTFVIR